MSKESIPKIIHYVWVGPNKQSALIQKCIASWKKYAPDYELRFWNESNAPMKHMYVKQMYAKKKWAFVSDYIRFWALEKEGGIYLDTDMELLQPLDRFLDDAVFLGRSKSGHASAGIIGSIPHHSFIQSVVALYDQDREFDIKNTSPLMLEKALKGNGSLDVHVYGFEYFYPCDAGEKCDPQLLAGAYATHHWAESWVPFRNTRKFLRHLGMLSFLKSVLGK